ncbi:MAG: tetratricopeptide repeat protein [Chloroflexi bacterium]|nr:tetratricopeptide repeat protein [Chloroflexota bacterium]
MTTNEITQSGLTHHYVALVTAMIDLSEAYLYDARLDDALALLGSDVLDLLASELPLEEMVRIQVQWAKIMRFKNRLDGSSNDATLELLFKAEQAAQSLNHKNLLADVASLIGLVLYDQNLWTRTLETPQRYFERALALRKEINDQKGIVKSLFDIGVTHQNKKDHTDEDIERAFEYFEKAYTLAEQGDFRKEKAHVARHLAYIYSHHKRKPDIALAYHQEFLSVNKELGFKLYLAPAHTMVGFSYYELQNLDKALEHFKAAQAVAEETGYQQPLAEAWLGIGLVQEGKGNTSVALECHERALAIAQPINLRPVIRIATSRIDILSKKEQAG